MVSALNSQRPKTITFNFKTTFDTFLLLLFEIDWEQKGNYTHGLGIIHNSNCFRVRGNSSIH